MTDYERIKREYDLSLLQKDRLMSKVYPVGSIYMSINEVSPSTLFGGVWERIQDAFLLAASKEHPAGETGGDATVKLTVSQMPSHTHSYYAGHGDLTGGGGIARSGWYDSNHLVTGSHGIQSTGGNQPHNNMPPYLSVYMWVRIK